MSTSYPVMHHHIPAEDKPQLHHCKNLKPRKLFTDFSGMEIIIIIKLYNYKTVIIKDVYYSK
jgi:hypothetical protein